MTLSLGLENKPAESLEGFDTWSDAGPAEVGGRSVEWFKGTATSGKEVTEARVAVDLQSGTPFQVDHDLPMHSNFGNRVIKAVVVFGAGPGDTWVPLSATIDQAGRFLFWRRHLVVVSQYSGWVPRS